MQQLTHASQIFTTTDDVSTALLELVATLNREDHSVAVAIPVLNYEGDVVELTMTVNTASGFVVVPINATADDERRIRPASLAATTALRAQSTTESS
jgi:hypothetical protein